MKTVSGVYTFAKIFTDTIEDYALAQIKLLCDHEAFAGSRVRIMPDVHPGKVGTIGFTATVGDKNLPNVVGIDIGCGITMAKLKQKKAEFQKLDAVIRDNVPSGFAVRKKVHRFFEEADVERLYCYRHIHLEKTAASLGTLGGGNHFIELDQDEEGALYVTIHSGSRHLGKEVTEYYLSQGVRKAKEAGKQVPFEMTCLEGELLEAYLHDLQVVQEFATLNREAILDELVKGMKWKVTDTWSVIHNYVDFSGEEKILRKGAVSAKSGETVIIPINMRDGILVGTGMGNTDWNESAPHGAGRIMNREAVKGQFTVAQYKAEMKGVYSTCIGRDTLDEAPFAYRNIEMMEEAIKDTVRVEKVLKPVYNFKAGN